MDALALLAEERASTEEGLARLRADVAGMVEASRDSNADDEHDPEGQTIAYERSRTASLVRRAEEHLREIDAAEQRVHAGTWGTCERCGGPVAEERLAARPTARTCISCAAAPAGRRRR